LLPALGKKKEKKRERKKKKPEIAGTSHVINIPVLIPFYNLLIPGSFCPGKGKGEKKERRLWWGTPASERERERAERCCSRGERRAWAMMASVFASFPISHHAFPSCIDSMGTETGSGTVPRTGMKLGTEGGEQSNDL
jgi:hypothetical protein